MSKRIVNIINFVRASVPGHCDEDLIEPIIGEIMLNKKYSFPNTFLLQYDALISDAYVDVFKKEADENTEIGIWFECVRPLAESVGLEWKGPNDRNWDIHIVPGFLLGYTIEERKLLIDAFMRKFYEVFGYFPKSVGSWMIDSYSAEYMSKEYGVKAFAICREQYGVDAYTLWGGYSNQGYYPSKNNILCPAQTDEMRITTPVFRMLGPDPIYNYDDEKYNLKGVPTLEAAWVYGQNEKCVDAIFNAHFVEECMDFSYVTLGQENNFGWKRINEGLTLQLEKIDKLRKENIVSVEKLCDTGEWFSKTYSENPVVSLVSNADWLGNDIKSIWYNSPAYRANIVLENNCLYFRDINVFDENYQERYLDKPCNTEFGIQDNLPVVDGRLWCGSHINSGLKFDAEVSEVSVCRENDNLICNAKCTDGKIVIRLCKDKIIIEKPENVSIYFERENDGGELMRTEIGVENSRVCFNHNGYKYNMRLNCPIYKTEFGYRFASKVRSVIIKFDNNM